MGAEMDSKAITTPYLESRYGVFSVWGCDVSKIIDRVCGKTLDVLKLDVLK